MLIRRDLFYITLAGIVLLVLLALGSHNSSFVPSISISSTPSLLGFQISLPPFLSVFFALLRLLLGLAYVLFVPGYTLQAALIPRPDELDRLERVAISFGLSVAVIPFLAMVLSWLPYGIHLWSMMISLTWIGLIFSTLAHFRRKKGIPQEQPLPQIHLSLKERWTALKGGNTWLNGLLAGALAVAVFSALAIFILSEPSHRYTEFYLLGPDEQAENYPQDGIAGQLQSVTMGIANHEGVQTSYRVEVCDGQGLIGQAGPIQLKPGEKIEKSLDFTPKETGDNVLVTISLYRDNLLKPYRTLKLWLQIRPAS